MYRCHDVRNEQYFRQGAKQTQEVGKEPDSPLRLDGEFGGQVWFRNQLSVAKPYHP